MNVLESLKKLFLQEEFVRIRRYIRKPAIMTAAISGALALVVLIVLIAAGKLNDLIVSLNMSYNSPVFIFLGASFFAVQIGALGYGIFLSLRKYHRYNKGKQGVFNVTYPNGNSYKALHSTLEEKRK